MLVEYFVAAGAACLLAWDLVGVNSVMYGVQGIQYSLTNGTSARPDPFALVHFVFPASIGKGVKNAAHSNL